MKTHWKSCSKRGFTLIELMVAMAITVLIITILVSITSIALDTWNRSRAELRASRQAKSMIDTMAHDLESLVTRTGNSYEWLSAISNPPTSSTNAASLVFFTAATDRYNGQIGVSGTDLGGDVSCVGYKLDWKNAIDVNQTKNKTFVLKRYLVDPKPTFDTILGKTGIAALFDASYGSQLDQAQYFICENVFQFTVTFHVQTTNAGVTTNNLVTISPASGTKQSFTITGTGIVTSPVDANLATGKITGVDISLSVLTDNAVPLVANKSTDSKWLAQNTYQYSKQIQLPGM